MAILRLPAWWVPAVLFLSHQVTQYGLGWSLPLPDGYLDPLLFLPVLLGLWLAERNWLYGRPRLTAAETLVAGVVLSLVGEELFPRLRSVFVRDTWDYGCYLLGLGWFWWQINPPATPGSPPA